MAAVGAEIKRLVAAISAGGNIPVLVDAVRQANERETLSSNLETLLNQQQHLDADYDEFEKELNAHVEWCWKTVLTHQVGPARFSEV